MRQPIGSDAPQPESHKLKQGTPTMGGILFAVGVFVAILAGVAAKLLPLDEESNNLAAIVVVLVLHMGLGFLDDYLKATRGKAMGLRATQKLAGQIAIAVLFVIYLAATATPGVTTTLSLSRDLTVNVPPWLYYPLVIVLMAGLSNSVNLTDGLDGLAAGLAVPAFAGLAMAGFNGLRPENAFFAWAMSGSCLGFIVYNGFPARVFMGDTGSLAIGASLAAFAVLSKEEIPVLIFCLVYIVETLSVVIQVISFKTRGKRVFKMAPVHHHFEMSGWKEVQVVQRFWIAGLILLWLGLLAAGWLAPFA
jgi:phospho-N-acetylmuramoyl-pentapeptide-transferase